MGFQGKEFTPEMLEFVINLKHYFDAEKLAGKVVSTAKPTTRVAQALGIGEATVKRIMARYNRTGSEAVLSSGTGPHGPQVSTTGNLQPVIRNYVRSRNFSGSKVSIQGIRTMLLKKHEVDIPIATLWRSLKRWGFVHGESKRRCALKEQDHVVQARREYLRIKRNNRNADGTTKRPEVYLDETYVNKNHSPRFTWFLDEDGPWVNKPSGVGPRLIITHAITEAGWIDGAELVFQAKKSSGDYHGQMNWENFSLWFTSQLLPNIPKNSIVIMDNAKYHNVLLEGTPSVSSTKDALRNWLTQHGIGWEQDMLKTELLTLCRHSIPKPQYKLDAIAEAHGHTILRTPPYHPELQPIETCWAIVKNFLADKCDFTMANLRAQMPAAFAKVTPQTCRKLIRNKVREEEDRYWDEDEKFERITAIEEALAMDRLLPEGLYDNLHPHELE